MNFNPSFENIVWGFVFLFFLFLFGFIVKLFLGFIAFDVLFNWIFWGGIPYFLPCEYVAFENLIDFTKSGFYKGKLTSISSLFSLFAGIIG